VELSGDLVDQFRDAMQNIPMGLPLIALQRARIFETQGRKNFFQVFLNLFTQLFIWSCSCEFGDIDFALFPR
jgi:hypothetical protein